MRYNSIVADTYEEAISIARENYGDNARIITREEIDDKKWFGLKKKKKIKLLVSITDDDYLRFYKHKIGIKDQSMKNHSDNNEDNKKTPKKEDENLKVLLEKIDNLERKITINNVYKDYDDNKISKKHKNIEEIINLLEENEFSKSFISRIVDTIENTLPLSKIEDRIELQKFTYELLSDIIGQVIETEDVFYNYSKNVVTLIGPTGVGKTTTIAKIAALSYVLQKKKVELITIDGFRIGAKAQLSIYAEHMKMNLHFAESRSEIENVVSLSDADFILIDTIGRSQQDEMKLVEMKNVLKLKNINSKFVLTISATTKPKEVTNIFKSFDIFDYSHVIITKHDESETFGSIISCALERNKKIIYITNGQKVPNNIERANVESLVTKVKGFDPSIYLNYVKY